MYITKKWADSSLVLILRQNNYVVIYDKKVNECPQVANQ